MVNVQNTTIQMPNYMAHVAKEMEQRKAITPEQRAKNLKCVAKLKAWLNGSAQIKPKFTGEERKLTAKDIMCMSASERMGAAL